MSDRVRFDEGVGRWKEEDEEIRCGGGKRGGERVQNQSVGKMGSGISSERQNCDIYFSTPSVVVS